MASTTIILHGHDRIASNIGDHGRTHRLAIPKQRVDATAAVPSNDTTLIAADRPPFRASSPRATLGQHRRRPQANNTHSAAAPARAFIQSGFNEVRFRRDAIRAADLTEASRFPNQRKRDS